MHLAMLEERSISEATLAAGRRARPKRISSGSPASTRT
jgi:hypothetical protein